MKATIPVLNPTEQAAFEERCFQDWLKKVDAIVLKKYGIGIDDGCDWCSRDTYDDGASPLEGARAWAREQRECGGI